MIVGCFIAKIYEEKSKLLKWKSNSFENYEVVFSPLKIFSLPTTSSISLYTLSLPTTNGTIFRTFYENNFRWFDQALIEYKQQTVSDYKNWRAYERV